MGPSGPDRRRARDDEILPRLLDPAPQCGPRRSPLPVREPGGAGLEPPETDGLRGVEARRAEGLPRRLFFFKQKTAYEIGLGIPAEPLFRSAALTGRSTPLIMFSVNSAPSMMRQAV